MPPDYTNVLTRSNKENQDKDCVSKNIFDELSDNSPLSDSDLVSPDLKRSKSLGLALGYLGKKVKIA